MALLRWDRQWSGICKKHFEAQERGGKEPPPECYQRPELTEQEDRLLSAFYELGTERQIGQWLGAIPISKIKQYALEELDLEGDDRDRFVAIITRVDGEYLAMLASRAEELPGMRKMASAKDPKATKELIRGLGRKPGQLSHVRTDKKAKPLG